MTAATAPLSCVCLTPRRRTAGGYLVCPNCDMVQEQETQTINGQPGKRKTTTEDRRFHLAWEVRKRAIYGSDPMNIRGFTVREWFGILRVRARHRRQRRRNQ